MTIDKLTTAVEEASRTVEIAEAATLGIPKFEERKGIKLRVFENERAAFLGIKEIARRKYGTAKQRKEAKGNGGKGRRRVSQADMSKARNVIFTHRLSSSLTSSLSLFLRVLFLTHSRRARQRRDFKTPSRLRCGSNAKQSSKQPQRMQRNGSSSTT